MERNTPRPLAPPSSLLVARLTWMLLPLLLARTTGLAQRHTEALCVDFVVRHKLKQVAECLLRLDVVPWETTRRKDEMRVSYRRAFTRCLGPAGYVQAVWWCGGMLTASGMLVDAVVADGIAIAQREGVVLARLALAVANEKAAARVQELVSVVALEGAMVPGRSSKASGVGWK